MAGRSSLVLYSYAVCCCSWAVVASDSRPVWDGRSARGLLHLPYIAIRTLSIKWGRQQWRRQQAFSPWERTFPCDTRAFLCLFFTYTPSVAAAAVRQPAMNRWESLRPRYALRVVDPADLAAFTPMGLVDSSQTGAVNRLGSAGCTYPFVCGKFYTS